MKEEDVPMVWFVPHHSGLLLDNSHYSVSTHNWFFGLFYCPLFVG